MREEECFETLFKETLKNEIPLPGDIVKGKVVAIAGDTVLIDFGYKQEGRIPLSEFRVPGGEVSVKIGDVVEAYLENPESDEGLAILSREKAEALFVWDNLQKVLEEDGVIEGTVVGKVKGGLTVDIGVKAFLPLSQIDVRATGNVDRLMGRRLKFKIVKLNKRKGNIIVSRRSLMEKNRDLARQEVFQNISEGQEIVGAVKNLTDYGAFIDLGGIDGLLHVTDMGWGRVGHPSEVVAVGQEVKVKVLKVDAESGKVSLGLKQLTPDPWQKVPEKYPVGERIRGKVVNVTDYGAFVELEQGIEGLLHISEMTWSRKTKHPSRILAAGDAVETVVLNVDPMARRISLGMKQLSDNPWETLSKTYSVGSKVKGIVQNVTDFGIFVGVTPEIDGLVHISDLLWVRSARPIGEVFPRKSEIEAIVLNIDKENERFSLGIKQLTDDPWGRIQKQYSIGTKHEGKVVWIGPQGVAIELESQIEGLIQRSDLPLPEKEDEGPTGVGKNVDVVIHSLDDRERRIRLGFVTGQGGEG